MSKNGIYRQNYNFLRILYYFPLLNLKKIKYVQKSYFPLDIIFRQFKLKGQKIGFKHKKSSISRISPIGKVYKHCYIVHFCF